MSSSRKLRKKRLAARAIFVFFSFLLVFSAIAGFFHIPFFNVKKIEVSGNGAVTAESIKEIVAEKISGKRGWLFPQKNFFLIPEREIENALRAEILRIKSAEIKKHPFDELAAIIQERQNSFLACVKDKCAFADENGFVFEEAPDFSEGIFLKFYDERGKTEQPAALIGKNILPEGETAKLAAFGDLLGKIKVEPAKIILKDESIYEVQTGENWRIILNDKNEPKQALLNLAAALESEIKEPRRKLDYVDLRFGNKVYFKYK